MLSFVAGIRFGVFFSLHFNIRDDSIENIIHKMYCIPVKAGDRGQLTEDEIASQLLYLLSDAPCLPSKPAPVGLLTAEPRSLWARDRQVLLQEEPNRRIIELIEQALCLICLDESLPTTFNANGFIGANAAGHFSGGRDESNMAHQMIHGGGSECNSANRWFDKTMQVRKMKFPFKSTILHEKINKQDNHL